jgi:bifunctional non-homologous end joining protein LigD
MEQRFTAELERRAAARAAGDDPARPTRPTPTGRRRSNVPVIEISRAKTRADALAGLERWKARYPEAAAQLDVADVLIDGMRGRSSLWYRVRVNLTHVPAADRPLQEPLDPDYDPWSEYEFPDRSGQRDRAARKPRAGG